MEARPAGQIFDIGYQRYDGPRQGRGRARLALFASGVRQTLGLGRGASSKILPALIVLTSIVPAGVILVMETITGGLVGEDRPILLGDYLPTITLFIMILTGILAPVLLIPDRTENVLSLYLVRPLGIADYLAARWFAYFSVMTVMVLIGPLFLFVGYTLLSDNAAQELRDNWLDIPRIALSAVAMGALLTSVPMGVAAFTPRRVYAAAAVIGGVLVLTTVIGTLTEQNLICDEESVVVRDMTDEERVVGGQFLEAFESIPGNTVIRFSVTLLGSGELRSYEMSRDEVVLALAGQGPVRYFDTACRGLVDRDVAKWLVFGDPTGPLLFVTDQLFADVQSNNYRSLVAEHPEYYPLAMYFAWVLIPLALMWGRYRRYAA